MERGRYSIKRESEREIDREKERERLRLGREKEREREGWKATKGYFFQEKNESCQNVNFCFCSLRCFKCGVRIILVQMILVKCVPSRTFLQDVNFRSVQMYRL